LSINRQIVGIQQDNSFENNAIIGLYIGFGEKLQILADEFDSFPMRTVDKHDVGFDFHFIRIINFGYEIIHDGPLSRARRSME
jgi:hypothetical protein